MRFATVRFLLLCCLLANLQCAQPPVLVVALGNVPPATHTLEVLVRQGDRIADERPVYQVGEHPSDTDFIYTFGLQPSEVMGSFEVGVAAFDLNHCLLTTGIGTAALDPSRPSTQLEIRFGQATHSPGELCATPSEQNLIVAGFKQEDADPTQVVISGWGFLPGIGVFIDSQPVDAIQSAQFTEIRAKIPRFTSPSGLKPAWLRLQNQNGISTSTSIKLASISFEPRANNTYLFPIDYEPTDINVADVNGDGLADVVVTGLRSSTAGFVSVFMNQGGGELAATPQTLELPNTVDEIDLADMDRDGAVDVVGISANAAILFVVLNNGQGQFIPNKVFVLNMPPDSAATYVAVGDVLGDGYPDVVVSSSAHTSSSAELLFYLGSSSGIGFVGVLDQGIILFSNMLVRDLDSDGRDDIVYVQIAPGAQPNPLVSNLRVVLSDGVGNFTYRPTLSPAAGYFTQVAALDLNGDSLLDLVASGAFQPNMQSNKILSVFGNQGSAMFPAVYTEYTTNPQPFSMAVGDFNHDGRSDLVVTHILKEGQGSVSILANLGGQQAFADVALQPSYPIGFGDNYVAAADFNRDGKSDFAVVTRGVPKIKQRAQLLVFLNTSL